MLRALEEALLDFAGCAVIISHDRFFLDRIATHMLAFEGDSHVEWFEGNFADYEEIQKNKRLGIDSVIPHRLKYKKFSRYRRRGPWCTDFNTKHQRTLLAEPPRRAVGSLKRDYAS